MVKDATQVTARLLPAFLGVAALWLAGCSGRTPQVVLDTPSGDVPLNAPQPTTGMPGGLAGQPPRLEPAMPAPGPAAAPAAVVHRDGTYSGIADVLMTGGGLCIENRPIGNFRVDGDTVRFGGFRGRIAPDGGLQMAYGQDWIVGQFEGATFHGHLDVPAPFATPGCSYKFDLRRIGP
jgi:hypothetical protein